jgi:phosphatidylglycerophosphatase A
MSKKKPAKKQPKTADKTMLESMEENLEHLGESIDEFNAELEQFEKKLGAFHPVSLLATWFGAGKIPFMPGTMGTLAALPFAYAIEMYGGTQTLFAAALLLFLLGIYVSDQFMRLSFTSHDPREIVIDEVAGVWLLLVAFPTTLNGYIAGFIIFRIFDIIKPWPISLCDRHVKGGFGVMFDDIAAAVYPVILLGFFAMFSAVTNSQLMSNIFTFLSYNGLP